MLNHGSHRLSTTVLASLIAAGIALGVQATAGSARDRDGSAPESNRSLSTSASVAQDAPTVTRSALGHTLRLRADGTILAATVWGVRTPLDGGHNDIPLSGWRYVGVLLEVRDVGVGAYSSSDWADVNLYGSDGSPAWHVVLGNQACADEGQPSALAPGDSRRWCVPFELPARSRPAEITFTPDGGFGLDIGEWTVPAVHRRGV